VRAPYSGGLTFRGYFAPPSTRPPKITKIVQEEWGGQTGESNISLFIYYTDAINRPKNKQVNRKVTLAISSPGEFLFYSTRVQQYPCTSKINTIVTMFIRELNQIGSLLITARKGSMHHQLSSIHQLFRT